jgi:hypothetical protein
MLPKRVNIAIARTLNFPNGSQYTSDPIYNKYLREELVDGSVAFLVLLEYFSYRKFEILLGDVLSPFTKSVHALRKC